MCENCEPDWPSNAEMRRQGAGKVREEFCARCGAGVSSDEHHGKCVVTGHAIDGEAADWGWWAISGQAIMAALNRAHAGDDPELVYVELYANSETNHAD